MALEARSPRQSEPHITPQAQGAGLRAGEGLPLQLLTAQSIPHLQRTIGNRAVQRLLKSGHGPVWRANGRLTPVQRKISVGNEEYTSRQGIITTGKHYIGVGPTETSVIDELFVKFKNPNSQYYEPDAWKTEVVMRAAIIDGMELLNRDASPFHYDMESNELSLPNQWRAVGAFHTDDQNRRVNDLNTAFAPRAGTAAAPYDPLAAINQVFNIAGGNTKYYLDCASASVLAVYRGFAHALESLEQGYFNEFFGDSEDKVVIHPEGVEGVTVPGGTPDKPPPSKDLMEEKEISDMKELLPGDVVYWRNYEDYEQTHGGADNAGAAWAGEWSVYMGNEQFQGFGVVKTNFGGMVQKLMSAYNAGIKTKKDRRSERLRVNKLSGIETLDGYLPGIDTAIRRPKNPAVEAGLA